MKENAMIYPRSNPAISLSKADCLVFRPSVAAYIDRLTNIKHKKIYFYFT